MEPRHSHLASGNNKVTVIRQSATGELCEYHGQPENKTDTLKDAGGRKLESLVIARKVDISNIS